MLKFTSIFATIGMGGAVLWLFFQRLLFSSNPFVIGIQTGAAIFMIWARVEFGWRSFHAAANPTQGGLVTSGPYHYVRHPIYTSVCIFGWAGALGNFSLQSLICGSVLLFSALTRMLCEEKLITVSYPEYADYTATTWRMIPFVF